MIVCDDGTCIFGTDDAADYLVRHGVPSSASRAQGICYDPYATRLKR